MMINEFVRLFTLQELKKVKKTPGRFSVGNSLTQTPIDVQGLAESEINFNKKPGASPLRKHNTLQIYDPDDIWKN